MIDGRDAELGRDIPRDVGPDDLIVITGAGGFIAGALTRYFHNLGYRRIRAIDRKPLPEWYQRVPGVECLSMDLSKELNAIRAVEGATEVYNLAADMGGMGFIERFRVECLRSVLINTNLTEAAYRAGAKRYFFSSSACVYRNMNPEEPELSEQEAYPALPDNEYGWEKLYAERVAQAYGRRHGMVVRLARFQNCFGPEGTWRGGREKAPAALCRKVAEAEDNGTIEVWGDGTASRAFTYIDDMVDGIVTLMQSDLEGGANIGRREYVTVDGLVRHIAEIAGKRIAIRHVEGPVGVKARNFRVDRMGAIGWESKVSLREGLSRTYAWIAAQVEAHRPA